MGNIERGQQSAEQRAQVVRRAAMVMGGIAVAFIAALVVGVMYVQNQQPTQATVAPSASAEPAVGLASVKETCEEVAAIFGAASTLSTLQKDEAWKGMFQGKALRWRVRITDVGETLGQLYAQAKCERSNALIQDLQLFFPDDRRAQIMQLEKQSLYEVEGVLKRYGMLGLAADALAGSTPKAVSGGSSGQGAGGWQVVSEKDPMTDDLNVRALLAPKAVSEHAALTDPEVFVVRCDKRELDVAISVGTVVSDGSYGDSVNAMLRFGGEPPMKQRFNKSETSTWLFARDARAFIKTLVSHEGLDLVIEVGTFGGGPKTLTYSLAGVGAVAKAVVEACPAKKGR
jgi:hypothetical protein